MTEKLYLYLHPEGHDSIFGVENEDTKFILASIHHLRADVTAQKEMLKRDIHPDGMIIPWGSKGEMLILLEGNYIWSEKLQDYVGV